MALVAYDYDSTSDNEEDNANSIVVTTENQNLTNRTNVNESEITNSPAGAISYSLKNETASLLSSLPEIKNVIKTVEERIEEFVPKSTSIPVKANKHKIKITVPSLSEFPNEDEPEFKRIKPTSKESGLLALLPPVKGAITTNTSFIPKVISTNSKKVFTSRVPNRRKKNSVATVKTSIVLSDAESDEDLIIPETYDDEMWEKLCGRPKNKPVIQEPNKYVPLEAINIAPEPPIPYNGLDNKAFKELVGKSKCPIGNIKLIDINEEDILAEKDIWMAKMLTDPEVAPKTVIEDPVDPTRRKKHHITYLAQQAKANEQDLKNQWAANKTNRLASRSKYGF